ncbi:MAG: hypothetical protein V1933_08530 [Candidatus Omnitrophota bacterium]
MTEKSETLPDAAVEKVKVARVDLLELEERGFLKRMETKGKEFVFTPVKNIHDKLKGLKR